MKSAPIPTNEVERLQALEALEILDTDREEDYDELVQLAAHICEIDAAHISLIDKNRQWIKARVGTLSANVDRNIAFCSHTILETDALVVEDVFSDERFFDNPFVTQNPGLRFYAGIPLVTSEGYGVGSLCVLDVKPRKLRDDQIKALHVLSKQVMKQMELRKALRIVNHQRQKLEELNETNARLLSIIGHDVRTPLATLASLLDLTDKGLLSQEESTMVSSRIKSTLRLAESLLRDLLQWASAQQESITLKLENILLKELVDKLVVDSKHEFADKSNEFINAIHPDLTVTTEVNIISFVLRNLVLNANKFTEKGMVKVTTSANQNELFINVIDTGAGIDPVRVQRIFDWKNRQSTEGTRGEKGSGLALLLANDLLKKVHGRLQVSSRLNEGSTFTLVLPFSQ